MVNARSIRGKDLPLLELILEHRLDLMLITETWLRPEADDIWERSTCLTKDNKLKNNCVEIDTGHRGGGLALISHSYLDVKLMDMRKMKILEIALLKIKAERLNFEFHFLPYIIHHICNYTNIQTNSLLMNVLSYL